MRIYIIIISLVIFQNSHSQIKETPVKLYQRTVDFSRNNVWNIDAIALIKNESEYHIQIKQIIDSKTRKNLKGGALTWALEYNGHKYLNLGYSDDLNNWNYFLKFEIVGKYSAIIIDDSLPTIIKNGDGHYGGNLTGAAIKLVTKLGNIWRDENNETKKILFIDTSDFHSLKVGSRNAYCSEANYLTRKKLNEIMKVKFPNLNVNEVPFEKVIEIINSLNEEIN